MSEQLKQELDTTEIDRLETNSDIDSKTIGQDETELPEGKLEDESGNESKEEDTVPMGKASLADIVSGLPAPTEEEIKAAEVENAKSVKQKAKEKLEAEKKKATQKNFADPIITYLLKRCEEDQGLAEDVMQDGKTWNKCFDYIVNQARKQSNGKSTAVEDRVVYEWAEDYYHKEEKPEPDKRAGASKPTKRKNANAASKKLKGEPEKAKEVTTSVPEPAPERKEVVKPEKKEKPKKKETADKPSMDGQMSLFDLL